MSNELKQIILDPQVKGRNKVVLSVLHCISSPRRIATCSEDWLREATTLGPRKLETRLEHMVHLGLLKPRTPPLPKNGSKMLCYEILYPLTLPKEKL